MEEKPSIKGVVIGIALAAVLLSCVVFLWPVILFKVPASCCERLRAVRWVSLAGTAYMTLIGAIISVIASLIDYPLWALLLTLLPLASGIFIADFLLPDPFTFLFRPRHRRAVLRAVEHFEQSGGPLALYGENKVAEIGRGVFVVGVSYSNQFTGPTPRHYFLVKDNDQNVEEADKASIEAAFGRRMLM